MSDQQATTDLGLIQSVTQQLNLYDNLFPATEDGELRVLFALIRIYLARSDNPQLKQEHIMIDPSLMTRLSIKYFDPFNTAVSRSLREALISRLHSVRKYRITNPEVVRRTLIACLYQEKKKAYTTQKKYLDAFMRNPSVSFKEIAKQLSVTPQAVSHSYRQMRKSGLLSFYGYINYPAFNLKHYVAFFTLMKEYRENRESLRRLLVEGLPFTLSLNLDVYEGSSWASFVIPNQRRELREFKESLNELRGEVFREINICELKSISLGSNFEFFDGKHWFFDPQLWAYGFFEFVKENKEILRKAPEFRYSSSPMEFDRIDFMISTILAANSLTSHNEIRKRLKGLGYDVSRPTITRRVRKLTSPIPSLSGRDDEGGEQAVYPYAGYAGLGLSNVIQYLIECDEEKAEDLCYGVSYLPYYFLYRTDKGMVLFIKSTSEDSPKINYMIRGLSNIRVITHSSKFESIGIGSLLPLYQLWDENSQRWTSREGQLDFVKRYESLP